MVSSGSGGSSNAATGGGVSTTDHGGSSAAVRMDAPGGTSGVVGDADVPHHPYSDTTESESERYGGDEAVQCPVMHEGREMVNMTMPMSVDELFTLLFTNSSFYIDFIQTTRKCTGFIISFNYYYT